jgi:hypothetical protein
MTAYSTLRPGLLVSLKTSCRGNVRYDRVDLQNDRSDGHELTKWETTRTISDTAEYERAKKAQSKASNLVRSVCTASAFGLLCPEAQAWKLEDAILQARAVVDEFNKSAQLTRVHVYVIAGKVASDDVEAVKAINSEVRDLIETMREGVANMDVGVIRTAANKAREIGNMLTPEAQVRIQFAIDAARSAAKNIVKAGEGAALEVDRTAIRRIMEQRTAFLDLSEATEISAPQAQARAIDLQPEENNNAV